MDVQNRRKVHTGHEDVVAHVLLCQKGLRAEIRGHGNIGRSRDVAVEGLGGQEPAQIRRTCQSPDHQLRTDVSRVMAMNTVPCPRASLDTLEREPPN